MVLCGLCNAVGHLYQHCRPQRPYRIPWHPQRRRPIWRPPNKDDDNDNGQGDGHRRKNRKGSTALCVTDRPPPTALVTQASRRHHLVLDSGAIDTTITHGVTPTSHEHIPPLYDAGGNAHHAQHVGVLYATTVDGDMDLDITARQTPTIPYDLLSVAHIVDTRKAAVHFAPEAKGGAYIQPPNGRRIKITRHNRHFVLEGETRDPPPEHHTGRGQSDLRHPQPSTADQDGPGVRMMTRMMAHPVWTALHTALAAGVATGYPDDETAVAPTPPRSWTSARPHDDASDVRARCRRTHPGHTPRVQHRPDATPPQTCQACTMANLHKTPTTKTTRGTPNPGLWEVDLHGPIYDGQGYALDAMHPMSAVIAYLPLQHKSDVLNQLPVLITRIRAAGGYIDAVRADLGGEFTEHRLEPALALLGCTITFVTPELHVNRAEAAHKLANAHMRANLVRVPDLTDFWMFARATGIVVHNAMISRRHNDVRLRQLTGHLPNLETLLPWGSNIAVLAPPPTRSIQRRALVARYVGPALQLGTRAIYYILDGRHVRHTSTNRYLRLPQEHAPPAEHESTALTAALLHPAVAATIAPFDQLDTTKDPMPRPRLLYIDGEPTHAQPREPNMQAAHPTSSHTPATHNLRLPHPADAQHTAATTTTAPSPTKTTAAPSNCM